MALTDANGDVTDTYSYDAWGKVTSHVDPDPHDGAGLTNDNPYQYVGQLGYYRHWQEPDLDLLQLLQLGVRYYDPGIGRFISRDPVKDRRNSYEYSDGRPLVYTDPSGRMAKDQCEVIKRLLECERVFGTHACAFLFTNTPVVNIPGNTPLGPAFDNRPCPSVVGPIDLDWYTDLTCWFGNVRPFTGIIYPVAKIGWNLVGNKPWVWPYADIKECNAIYAIMSGRTRYADLFPPAFMQRECGWTYQDRSAARLPQSASVCLAASCNVIPCSAYTNWRGEVFQY